MYVCRGVCAQRAEGAKGALARHRRREVQQQQIPISPHPKRDLAPAGTFTSGSREGQFGSSGLNDRVPMHMTIRRRRVPLDVDIDVALHIPASGELARGKLRLLVCAEAQRGGEAEGGAPRERVPPRVHDASQVERREFRGRGVAELPGAIVPLVRDAHVRAGFVYYAECIRGGRQVQRGEVEVSQGW